MAFSPVRLLPRETFPHFRPYAAFSPRDIIADMVFRYVAVSTRLS